MTMQQRSGHWDRWKGLAILAVVMIHATGTTANGSTNGWGDQFVVVLRQFINFAVALFLALAGYFAAKLWKGSAVNYWRGRGWRILPAYVTWTLIAVAVIKPWHLTSPRALFEDFAFGTGIGIGYYVIVLLQYVALVPLLAKLRNDRQHIAVMVMTTSIGLGISYAMQSTYAEAPWARFPYYCLPFIVWGPLFQLGFWVGRRPDVVRPRSDSRWLWLAGLVVLAAIAEGLYWDGKGLNGLATSQIKASTILVSTLVALHIFAARETRKPAAGDGALEWLGRSSYMIYLSHMMLLPKITATIRIFSPDLYSVRPAAILIATVLTAAICGGVALVLQKATAPAIHRNLLGTG